MLVYTSYRWFRRKQHGPLERERQRACVVVVAFVSAIFVGSGSLGAFNRAANKVLSAIFQPAAQWTPGTPLQAR